MGWRNRDCRQRHTETNTGFGRASIETPAVAHRLGKLFSPALPSITTSAQTQPHRYTSTPCCFTKSSRNHVTQKGSLVDPDRLRFDFAHHKPVSAEELNEIQSLVQTEIEANNSLKVRVCSMNEAKDQGAMALFEKYGDEVRVVKVPTSPWAYGGTHVEQTGEIALFHVLSEAGISAGVRRMSTDIYEGFEWYQERSETLTQVTQQLRVQVSDVRSKSKNSSMTNGFEKRLVELRKEIAQLQAGDLMMPFKRPMDSSSLQQSSMAT